MIDIKSRLMSLFVGLLVGLAAGTVSNLMEDAQPYYVTDKDEFSGHCYVQTWVEVSPEDYIGLEVGDEFEVK